MVPLDTASLPRWLWVGLGAALSLLLLGSAGLLAMRAGGSRSGELPSLATMPDFHLLDQTGQTVTAEDVRGKVLLVGFVYTSCEDICPVVTARMRSLQEALAAAGLLGKSQLLSISVDPERDTPERLQAYAQQYQADLASWRFLTGEGKHVRDVVVNGFLLGLERSPTKVGAGGATGATGSPGAHDAHGTHGSAAADAAHGTGAATATAAHGATGIDVTPADYRVEHSGRVALVDRDGQIRAYFDGLDLDDAEIVAQVRSLIKER